ncbi:dTDP-glucose 4,6-dehydratase [Virgibacillus siamensis]|uniref:dTDP-glucose 4,6-dehydratase n=1 Tax=Virgibacillus siamensis TaxID=480071 RepID=UPI0009879F09|nr:dTDP-glucose 4,6-dehydratase [Virgibacillus siamensis]
MKLLITGGVGFIGSNFVRYMLQNYPEYEVVNLDALTYAGNLENLKGLENNPNYTFVKADITDRATVETLFKKENFDTVVNFAAESHVDRSINNPDVFVSTNIMGTQVLLDTAKKYGIQKYVQVSTDEVYGSLGGDGSFTENTPIAPNSPYSASKASADLLVRSYYKTYNFPINITRCSNNYGPYQFPEKLIPLMLNNVRENRPIPIYGDGQNVRDWIYVEDHSRAVDRVLHDGIPGEIYNIGSNNEHSNLEMAKMLLNLMDAPESLITFVPDRKGHDFRYAIDASKIRNELGWEAEYSFETGLKETVNWYLNNLDWLNHVVSGDYRNYYKTYYSR